MRRSPETRPENALALSLAEIERIKAILTQVTDGRQIVLLPGSNPGSDNTPPIEGAAHVLYGLKHTRALHVTIQGGLTVAIETGQGWIDGTFYSIVASTLFMADATTNYVFVDNIGVVTSNTASFPDDSIPLAEVVTAGGDITAVNDRRGYLSGSAHAGRGTLPSYTITNDITDRVFDVNSITLHELADVVATIVNDVATLHP